MKDFDLIRQNWQRAKVQAECVLPSPEINMRCENCIIIMSSAGNVCALHNYISELLLDNR